MPRVRRAAWPLHRMEMPRVDREGRGRREAQKGLGRWGVIVSDPSAAAMEMARQLTASMAASALNGESYTEDALRALALDLDAHAQAVRRETIEECAKAAEDSNDCVYCRCGAEVRALIHAPVGKDVAR